MVLPDGSRSLVQWSSVLSVVTWKYDKFTIDEIVLAFEVAERPGELHVVSEDWQGFRDLFAPIEREFGISPDWYGEVMQPPFATNHRVLFQRAPPPREDASTLC